MICYRLRCASDHSFDGWFRSGTEFDRQASGGLIDCPTCGSASVERALMAPAVVGSSKHPGRPVAETEILPPSGQPAPAGGMPAVMRALLTRMREEVERTCVHVGAEFADQAVRMHRGEAEKRAIYGETTALEREMLADEGVEVAAIPWIKRADS